jgi:hypothetical protein
VLVTHHLSDIIPEVDRLIFLRGIGSTTRREVLRAFRRC